MSGPKAQSNSPTPANPGTQGASAALPAAFAATPPLPTTSDWATNNPAAPANAHAALPPPPPAAAPGFMSSQPVVTPPAPAAAASGWASSEPAALGAAQVETSIIGRGLPLGNARDFFTAKIKEDLDRGGPGALRTRMVSFELDDMMKEHEISPGKNFIVYAHNKGEARGIAQDAERLLSSLTKMWLGADSKPIVLSPPLIIGIRSGDDIPPCASTMNVFQILRPAAFDGTYIQGPYKNMAETSLAHELTHVILGTYFAGPIPLWAAEGSAVSSENAASQAHQHQMLLKYFNGSGVIPLEKMFAMKAYGDDTNAFYSQGHSVTDYLIRVGDAIEKFATEHNIGEPSTGRQRFVHFLAEGRRLEKEGKHPEEAWQTATHKYYGERNLQSLQEHWINWLQTGKVTSL